MKSNGKNILVGVTGSVAAYKEWLCGAEAADEILDYCNEQMAQSNVVREVAAK